MIAMITKVPVQPMTCAEFHELVAKCHHLPLLEKKTITYLDCGYVLQDEHVIAYHLENHWIYEYIFDEETHELLISLDKRSDETSIDLMGVLIKNQLLRKDGNWRIQEIPHHLNHETLPEIKALPYLYFHEDSVSSHVLESLAFKLKGMVHVVYGNSTSNQLIQVHHSTYKNYAVLFNQDCIGFSQFKNESDESFVQRVEHKLQSYMTKRVFESPFNMSELYKKSLLKTIEESKNNEENLLFDYDEKLSHLDNEKKEIISQIEKMTHQLEYLKYQLKSYQQELGEQTSRPLLYRGKEKELYDQEQKETILFLIEDELKTEKDQEKIRLYQEILKENESTGKRSEMLEEIRRILLSSTRLTHRQLEDLRKVGIDIEKGDKHMSAMFFHDSRYLLTLSSTASDLNANRQIFRDIRRFFF